MNRLAVIGAGTMGRGIAQVAALGGFHVRLHDKSEESLAKAQKQIVGDLDKSVQRGIVERGKAEEALRSIVYETDLGNAVREADIVIEAVYESMDIKLELFAALDRLSPEHAVLATNTSTMSPTEIAAGTRRPDRCVAMHFFNPVPKMKLIEIVRGLDTSDETVRLAKEAAVRMGKETVEVNELPGFVTSRLVCLLGNEAMNMLMEGVASASDIDKAVKLGLNHPMGPLELADLVGLDTRLRNMEYLHRTLGDKYRPCPLLIKYVKAGRLGRKSGMGFYAYD